MTEQEKHVWRSVFAAAYGAGTDTVSSAEKASRAVKQLRMLMRHAEKWGDDARDAMGFMDPPRR